MPFMLGHAFRDKMGMVKQSPVQKWRRVSARLLNHGATDLQATQMAADSATEKRPRPAVGIDPQLLKTEKPNGHLVEVHIHVHA